MSQYIILARSEITARSLAVWRQICGQGADSDNTYDFPKPIVFDVRSHAGEAGATAYRSLVGQIERQTRNDTGSPPLNDIVVLVDSIRPTQMSAVSESLTWDHLIALLVLTFPEIKWVFGVIAGDASLKAGQLQFPIRDHSLLSLLVTPRRDPLFDPTGLRDWVRCCTNHSFEQAFKRAGDGIEKMVPFTLARRKLRAAAIDEEVDYAILHAHAAYRYGYRADVVTTWSQMKFMFGQVGSGCQASHGYELILEDMRLAFPDKPATTHLSNLRTGRAVACPLLDDSRDASRWRFLVTTGQEDEGSELIEENEAYLEEKRRGRGAVLFKPVGGIMELWQKSGLYEEPNEGQRAGNAVGFEWPPTVSWDEAYDGHGSPGKLGLVAAALIKRAGDLQKSAVLPTEYIRCALLATDAVELLGGKTPMLTFTGISIKNECEVRAECAFIGAGYHFTLNRRFAELSGEIESVTRWFYRDVRPRTGLDAKTMVLNRLVLAYRDAGQVEEEQACLVQFRRMNRVLSRPHGWSSLNPFAWLVHTMLWYGEAVMASFGRILVVILLWICGLSFALYVVDTYCAAPVAPQNVAVAVSSNYNDSTSWLTSVSSALSWMFGGSASDRGRVVRHALSWIGVLTGVFHAGLLISYLYSLIARK